MMHFMTEHELALLTRHILPKNENGCMLWDSWCDDGRPCFFWRGAQRRADRLLYTNNHRLNLHNDIIIKKRCKNRACMNEEHYELRPRNYGKIIIPRKRYGFRPNLNPGWASAPWFKEKYGMSEVPKEGTPEGDKLVWKMFGLDETKGGQYRKKPDRLLRINAPENQKNSQSTVI